MALFIDGPVSTIEDLRAYDSQIGDIASVEGIDVQQKLALAQEDLSIELERLLDGRHGLEKVVQTAPLRLWHAYRSLELVYRDAYFTHLNDRYKAKRDQFSELGKSAYEKVIQRGIGITAAPLPRAATPLLTPTAGFLQVGVYYVTMSWLNRAGEEGSPAPADAISIQTGAFSVAPQDAVPATASGWNVYVSFDPEDLRRQNQTPLGVNASWQQSAPVNMSGPRAGTGQSESFVQPVPRVIPRG